MFAVWGVTFLSLTSEDFSATLQDITSTLYVHPKHIKPAIRRNSATTNQIIFVIITVRKKNLKKKIDK
jgi:hypothetical protein